MRDPQALRRGMVVQTPNGAGVIRSVRNAAGLWRYLVHDYWWTAAQLTVPEPTEPAPDPDAETRCRTCRSAGRNDGWSYHCHGQGGVVIDGRAIECGCRCGRGPRWRNELEPEVA